MLVSRDRSACQAPWTSRAARVAVAPIALVRPARFALANQHEREVREGRQVSARADRAARRDSRMNACVEEREQRLQGFEPDAREPFREHVRPQRHRRTHGADR